MFGVVVIDYCNTCETSAWVVILLCEPRIKNRLYPWEGCGRIKSRQRRGTGEWVSTGKMRKITGCHCRWDMGSSSHIGLPFLGILVGIGKERTIFCRFVSNFRRGRIVSALVWNHPRQWALRTLLEDNFKTLVC